MSMIMLPIKFSRCKVAYTESHKNICFCILLLNFLFL